MIDEYYKMYYRENKAGCVYVREHWLRSGMSWLRIPFAIDRSRENIQQLSLL